MSDPTTDLTPEDLERIAQDEARALADDDAHDALDGRY
jgi:hypothetical protein